MGIAEDFARDAGLDPDDIGLSFAQRFARDAAAGLAALNAQQPLDNDPASVFGNAFGSAQDGDLEDGMLAKDQSAAERARLNRMNAAYSSRPGTGVNPDGVRAPIAQNGPEGNTGWPAPATSASRGAGTNLFGNMLDGDGAVGAMQTFDNRALLNRANQYADPSYGTGLAPEQLQAMLRQQERAYRQATDTGANWMGGHADANPMDLPANYPLQEPGSAQDAVRGSKTLAGIRDASNGMRIRAVRPAPAGGEWADNGPPLAGLGPSLPPPVQNNLLGTNYGNVQGFGGSQHYGKQDIFGRDEPGAYVRAIRSAVANPPDGTSNTATEELRIKYPAVFKTLATQGVGATVFGTDFSHDFNKNSFDIKQYPEEYFNDTKDITYHKYGLITYLGPVDKSLGITKSWVVKNVLEDRYSFPNSTIVPGPANFSGKSQVYAVAPWRALNSANLDDPNKYTYKIGVIEQMRVPDGVLNITTENHQVYPGAIRRTVMEVDGHLYLYTSGAGLNRFNNSGDKPLPNSFFVPPISALSTARDIFQSSFAIGNDKYGPLAFRALDQQAVKYINGVRNGVR